MILDAVVTIEELDESVDAMPGRMSARPSSALSEAASDADHVAAKPDADVGPRAPKRWPVRRQSQPGLCLPLRRPHSR